MKIPVVKEAVKPFPKNERIKFRVVSVNVPIVTANQYNMTIVSVALTDTDGKFLHDPAPRYHDFARPADEDPAVFLDVIFNDLSKISDADPEQAFEKINECFAKTLIISKYNMLAYSHIPWEDRRLTEPLSEARSRWPVFE